LVWYPQDKKLNIEAEVRDATIFVELFENKFVLEGDEWVVKPRARAVH
jgi:hypothetical protein